MNLVDDNGFCVSKCSSPKSPDVNCICKCQKGYDVDPDGKCVTCLELGLVNYDGKCINKCPKDYTLDTDGECKECRFTKFAYNQNGSCQIKCNSGYLEDTLKFCYTCEHFGLFDQDGVCKSACDLGYITDDDNVCHPCKYTKSTCGLECGPGMKADDFGECLSCKDYGDSKSPVEVYVQVGDICTYSCPRGKNYSPTDHICVPW
jgi:hypothetical protein